VNRTMPPGDSGNQNGAFSRAPRYRGPMPGADGLVVRTAAAEGRPRVGSPFATRGPRSRRRSLLGLCDQGGAGALNSATQEKKPAAAGAGRASEENHATD
jgi:hypothetical protein